jgi:hypothetical protein
MLNTAMKHSVFNDASVPILSKDNVLTYEEQLRAFNVYVTKLSQDRKNFEVVMKFDEIVRNIARTKKQPEIFFNV